VNRLKALYRSWAIPCAGKEVYALRYRAEWLGKITEAGVRRRAEHYYQQLDFLRPLRQEVWGGFVGGSQEAQAVETAAPDSGIGPIRAALVIALMQTPHRFRTKRQLWTYSGLALETYDAGQLERRNYALSDNRRKP
jgi:transposase